MRKAGVRRSQAGEQRHVTEAAQERNIELGLLVYSQSVVRRIEEHFMSLIGNRYLVRRPRGTLFP